MTADRERRRDAFTLVEVMTVLLLIVVLIALLMFGVAAARQGARMTECVSNMSQLGLGIREYSTHYGVMPSVHTNVWTLVGEYVGQPFHVTSGAAFATNSNDDIGQIYRCPADVVRYNDNTISYAPNFEDAVDTAATAVSEDDGGNWAYSPWSNFKLDGGGNPVSSADRLLRTLTPSDAANDTILVIECWNLYNDMDVTHYQSTPTPPIWDYDDRNGLEAARAELTSSADAGTYLMFEGFGSRAGASGSRARLKRDVYHRGQVNVSFADMHTAWIEAVNLASQLPRQVPIWTREAD